MDEIKRNKIIVLGRHVMKKYRMHAWARQNLKQDARVRIEKKNRAM
jgi:hypothetical protein